MSDERWVVLGLAHARASWFAQLSRWSTAAAVPIDFVKCVSADEVRARLRAGRPYSALLVGGGALGLDRDLIEAVRSAGATVIMVDPVADRDWSDLGVAAVLSASHSRGELLAALRSHAPPVTPTTAVPPPVPPLHEATWRGRFIMVTGPGGTGASLTSMAVAQAFATEPSNTGMVALADLSLAAELAMLHDAREIMPGVQELCEAHRSARPSTTQVRSLLFEAQGRGYHLLLGLRHHRDWTAIRPAAFAAALDGLLGSYRVVIADTDADLEGEATTGSLDIEDRNVLARTAASRADLVVVVSQPTPKGLHSLSRSIRDLIAAEVDASRIVAVCNRAPKNPRRRAEASATLAALLASDAASPTIDNPVFLGARGDLDGAIRDGIRLPSAFGRPLHQELVRRIDGLPAPRAAEPEGLAPIAVSPGSLGHWSEEAG